MSVSIKDRWAYAKLRKLEWSCSNRDRMATVYRATCKGRA